MVTGVDVNPLSTIGELAKRTGLSVRTVRFYSDAGVVPPSNRSPAGYRLYDAEALARLETAVSLRELGFDLDTVRRVLDRQVGISDVIGVHAEALDAQISILRLRRAILRALAKRDPTIKDVELMNKLARLSAEERNRIITGFYDEVFGGLDIDPEFERRMRTATPDLPDDPSPEQVEAWIELAELVSDEGFRARVRQMAEGHSADREAGGEVMPTASQGFETVVAEQAGAALSAGIDPSSPEAADVLVPILAALRGDQPDSPELRADIADRFESGNDRRVERYWQLLGVINGWGAFPSMTPAFEWTIVALRAHPTPLP
ncbi:MAG: MerR family transcriptional regulator [Acidimicrobiia bacterium]